MFRKAERSKAKLRLSIDGPSGSGKTHTSLLIAAGLVPDGKIFLIDTERDSAPLEVGKPGIPDFFHESLSPPFTPRKYRECIRSAVDGGAGVIIVDSISHAWSGSGGVLDMHDNAARAQSGGNNWTAWREVTPEHNALVDALLQSPCHIICTMRTKTAWEVVETANGKKAPQKIGLKPEQREGMEYEFTVVLDLSIDGHIATASKDRTSLFDGQHFVPTAETGESLREWLESGKDPAEESRKLLRKLKAQVSRINTVPHLNDWWRNHSGEISALMTSDAEKLKGDCSLRKSVILAEVGEQPVKGNGEDPTPAGIDAVAGAAH